jgi:hypothetical protein
MSATAQNATPLTVAQFDEVTGHADVDGASMVLVTEEWVDGDVVDRLTEVYNDFGMERVGLELVEDTNLPGIDEIPDDADLVVAFE